MGNKKEIIQLTKAITLLTERIRLLETHILTPIPEIPRLAAHEPNILTAQEVSEILQVRVDRVWELTRENRLPFAIKVGDRQYRYSKRGLEEYINDSGNQPSTNVLQ